MGGYRIQHFSKLHYSICERSQTQDQISFYSDDDRPYSSGSLGEEDRLIIAEDDVIKKESPDSFKTDYHGSSDGGGKPLKKQRRKQNRFNGLSEEELAKRLLPDLLLPNLDILIVSLLFLSDHSCGERDSNPCF
jgi:hypothetical protein